MAISPPPAPVNTQPPPPVKSKRGCWGCGCGGCLLVVVLVALLVGGAGYWFFIVQAQAAVASPASLILIAAPVDVGTNDSGYKAGIPGQQLNAGSSVRTGHAGRAAIQFPDGSYVRLSPDTTITVTSVQLSHDGKLQSAGVVERIGRTFSAVQHLSSGATFQVAGHSVNAEVRGTQFEVLVRANGTNLIKVFEGTVTVSGTTTVTLTAGQEIDADANGKLSAPRPIKSDAQDPYPLSAQCSKAATSGNNPGTVQTIDGDNLAQGQTAEQDYQSTGGNLSLAFCYPGSLMSVSVTAPDGTQSSSQGPPPRLIKIPNGPPGLYRAVVTGISLPSGGEPYSLSFATDAACASGNVDTNGVVRTTWTNAQIAHTIQQAGASGVTLQVQGTSPTSARIYYSSDFGGVPLSWTIVFYAASPNLGAIMTQVTIKGINVTTGVVSKLAPATGVSLSSIPTDFLVDRVYSCNGPDGGTMVIEGHR
jgi:FecR protein